MELTVFGATGRTGRHVVNEALEAGEEVRAFVRDRARAEREWVGADRLQVIEGDVLDPEAVEEAIEGTDAVVSALGHAENSPEDVLTRGGEHIVAAMENRGVSRLVICAGAGVGHPNDPFSLGGRVISAGLKLLAGEFLRDTKRYVKRVVESDLEYVIVRPPRLTNGEKRGEYRTGYLKLGPRATISRADLGAFMVEQTSEDGYVGEAPMIAY